MLPSETVFEALERAHPGRSSILRSLVTLFAEPDTAPPFIYLHDAFCPRRTRVLLGDVLRSVGASSALLDARASISHRSFFDAVLHQFTKLASPETEPEKSWGDSVDGFCAGLRALLDVQRASRSSSKKASKGKGKATKSTSRSPRKLKTYARKSKRADSDSDDAMNVDDDNTQSGAIVLVVHSAEHLRHHLADLVVPLTRLSELVRLELTTVFISSNSWIDVQPAFAASPDPYMIHVPALDMDSMLATLQLPYAAASSTAAYAPALAPLFRQFVTSLHSTCFAYVRDPDELAYIVACTWPAFVQPVLDAWRAANDADGMDDDNIPPVPAPNEATRIWLAKATVSAFHAALDALYPRALAPAEFVAQHVVPALANIVVSFDEQDGTRPASPAKPKAAARQEEREAQALAGDLPRVAQLALVAAYIASYNPPRSDVRMFARAAEERVRRSRRGGGGGGGGSKRALVAKVPPRLAGPAPFPLDRLLALLGRLLEDYDAPLEGDGGTLDAHDVARAQAETDVGRVQTLGLIGELATVRLLHRVGSADKALEGVPMFKCGVSHAVALALARNVGVPLADYLWENN